MPPPLWPMMYVSADVLLRMGTALGAAPLSLCLLRGGDERVQTCSAHQTPPATQRKVLQWEGVSTVL